MRLCCCIVCESFFSCCSIVDPYHARNLFLNARYLFDLISTKWFRCDNFPFCRKCYIYIQTQFVCHSHALIDKVHCTCASLCVIVLRGSMLCLRILCGCVCFCSLCIRWESVCVLITSYTGVYSDPYEDQFEKRAESKKARVQKNEKQRLRNLADVREPVTRVVSFCLCLLLTTHHSMCSSVQVPLLYTRDQSSRQTNIVCIFFREVTKNVSLKLQNTMCTFAFRI